MKLKIAISTILSLLMVVSVQAADVTVTFQWDKNPEPDIAGYRLYESNVSGEYNLGEQVLEVEHLPEFATQETDYTFDAQTGTTYYWVVTAVDDNGFESDWSNEVLLSVTLPVAPTGMTITAVKVNE